MENIYFLITLPQYSPLPMLVAVDEICDCDQTPT
jgi:hypothetical protein